MACDWAIDRTCLPPLPELPDTPTDEQQDAYDLALARRNAAEDMAVGVLWALSGRQFGACETTVRPCPSYSQGFGYGPFLLTLDAGHWVNWPCGCVGSCTVSGPRVVHLPGPVGEIVAVTVEGIILAGTEYQLEGDALYRRGTSWPRQDLGRPLGDDGTWSVTYTRGVPVPAGVDKLTGQLALEFIAACDDETQCRLPRTLVATNQRGNSHVFDQSKILAAGKTGLPEVDLWLAAVNPHHLAEAPSVL
jgi:hypothetical protein